MCVCVCVCECVCVCVCSPLQHAGGDGVGREDLKSPAHKVFGITDVLEEVLPLRLRQRL